MCSDLDDEITIFDVSHLNRYSFAVINNTNSTNRGVRAVYKGKWYT